MGWGRMFLLGNVGQQMDIEDVKDYLNQAIEEINKGEQIDADQNREIERLKKENRELQLYVLALARLLTQKQIVTEAELTSIVSTIERGR
ncbi:MAG: hypothetical protein QM790_04245 [Nibricoccus sp.]